MMVQPVVSRSQRRIERKQLVLIVVLILAVAGVSFSLGVIYGQKGACAPLLAGDGDSPTPSSVTKPVPPPPQQEEPVAEKTGKLTFYDNLPKGNQAPLGSGINLPPETPPEVVREKPKKGVKEVVRPKPVEAVQIAKTVDSVKGAFVVQVASFRTGDDAGKLVVRLESYRLPAFVESVDLGEKGLWHRVLVGPYSSRESATRTVTLLKEKERLSALVRQR